MPTQSKFTRSFAAFKALGVSTLQRSAEATRAARGHSAFSGWPSESRFREFAGLQGELTPEHIAGGVRALRTPRVAEAPSLALRRFPGTPVHQRRPVKSS